LGLEKTPELYIENIVNVFREVKRVLMDDGTLWLNIGDSYAGSWGNAGGENRGNGHQREITNGSIIEDQSDRNGDFVPPGANGFKILGIKPKDLIGIPWMLAFALRADGWYLRQDIIWHKPNPMPESVTDRCTKSHEYIFLLSKSKQYYYDYEAIKTEITDGAIKRLMQDRTFQKGSDRVPGKTNGNMKAVGEFRKGYAHRGTGDKKLAYHSGNYAEDGSIISGGLANKKSVWTVTTKPFSEAHFATFPQDLIVDCIKAGCPEFVCNKCGAPRNRIIERQAGMSTDCPKTQSSHEARGGKGKPTGTVGKSGGGGV
jgi:DNA modification methylase